MTQRSIERIRSIKRQQEKNWLAIDGVVAVGIGVTSSGTEGLVVSVKGDVARIRALIPRQLEKIEIEIQEIGEITAF